MATFDADISGYSLSTFAQDDAGLGWQLDPARAALLVHDMLPYYTAVLPEKLRDELLENCRQAIDFARANNIPVITSAPRAAAHLKQRGIGAELWGLGPSQEETDTSHFPELAEPEFPRIRKRSLSAFFGTDLDIELRRLGKDQLVTIGVFASGGIVATSFDALARDLEFFVITDSVADFTEQAHAHAIQQIARSTGQAMTLRSFLESA